MYMIIKCNDMVNNYNDVHNIKCNDVHNFNCNDAHMCVCIGVCAIVLDDHFIAAD